MEQQSLQSLLDSIAAKTPTPGGGAVASITAALAGALARMVVNYSVGKKSLAMHEQSNRDALSKLESFGSQALQLADEDARAYARLNELWKLDKTDPNRARDFPSAVRAAIAAPQRVLELALELLNLFSSLVQTSNQQLKSDLAIAAILAEAAARAAAWNVRINLPLMLEASDRAALDLAVAEQLAHARNTTASIEQKCSQ